MNQTTFRRAAGQAEVTEYALTLKPDWLCGWMQTVFDRGVSWSSQEVGLQRQQRALMDFPFKRSICGKAQSSTELRVLAQGCMSASGGNNSSSNLESRGLAWPAVSGWFGGYSEVDIKVLHYGFSSSELIKQKYDRCNKTGKPVFTLERVRSRRRVTAQWIVTGFRFQCSG